jgi:hypothetical protein
MKYNVIKTENYLLVVDESQITVDDWTYNPFSDCPISVGDIEDDMLYINTEYSKIIAHLPLNNSPILDNIDLLPNYYEVECNNCDWYGNENDLKVYNDLSDNDISHDIEYYKGCPNCSTTDYIIANNSISFECKMVAETSNIVDSYGNLGFNYLGNTILKTTNSNGKKVWVGRYIF